MTQSVTYLVFDVESVADGDLIAKVRYPGEGLTPAEAIARYQSEIFEKSGTTFIPHTFQIPIAVVIAKLDAEFRMLDLVSLDEPHFRSHVITANFWKGWDMYRRPTWITFNGRSFDLPIMEMAAFRYGISLAKWFSGSGYKALRNRFNSEAHLDLQDLLTNFGAARLNGGLNLAAQLLGKPGKMGLNGEAVQQKYDEGGKMEISDYCRCDVLDTYFVFLRCMVLTGKLTLEQEIELVQQAKDFIQQRADDCQAYQDYLGQWGEWVDPWEAEAVDEADENADASDPSESGDGNDDSPAQPTTDSEPTSSPAEADSTADPQTDSAADVTPKTP
ncbi:3'-5' exonuclease [Crateriforma conspicua]|uniref:3'-5' exonuclease n=1 Tax=Crateriforma conspicua TaxID=2527996 RepID=UPI00118993A5|nr:3'-5' exonuclease [Crateriforma conspicua]QDV61666.1 putative 3'-5' exonuclease related to the exonuclease domain of PolB [Crateriforma conspicua]